MNLSLPSIISVGFVPCQQLSADILAKYLVHQPIAILAPITWVELFGNASCEAVSAYDNGLDIEKTTLKFSTTTTIPQTSGLAFVIRDAQSNCYVIGTKEATSPLCEKTKAISQEENIVNATVTFTARKSLIPCSL